MAYRSRSARRTIKKSKRSFIVTILLIAFLFYATLQWILPTLVAGLGFITGIIKPSHKTSNNITEKATLAPPILNIPFEATNTAKIDIKGYGTPGSRVAIFLDDEKIDTVDVSEDGSFEVKDISLSLGSNNIYGISIDEKDQESLPSKTFKITFDNEKPSLNLAEPEDGKKIQGGDKKVKFRGNTEVGIQVYINDSQMILDKDGNFQTELSLNDGDNNFTIKATDPAGNSTEIARKIIYQP